jgi:hypothetical protein
MRNHLEEKISLVKSTPLEQIQNTGIILLKFLRPRTNLKDRLRPVSGVPLRVKQKLGILLFRLFMCIFFWGGGGEACWLFLFHPGLPNGVQYLKDQQ